MDKTPNTRRLEHPIEDLLFDLLALGALDGEERSALEAHAAACPECIARLSEAQGRISMLSLAATENAPPTSVKDELMRKIHRTAAATPPSRSAPVAEPRRTPRFWAAWQLPAFAAATAILAFTVLLLWRTDQRQSQRIDALNSQLVALQAETAQHTVLMQTELRRDTAIVRLVASHDTLAISLARQPGQPEGSAHVLYNPGMGLIAYAGAIAPAPQSKCYQLWLVPANGKPISAGILASASESLLARVPQGTAAKAFAVTLEPAGGVPQPTGPKVLVGAPAST